MEQLTIQADLKNPPIGAILTAELVKGNVPTKIVWGNSGTTFKVENAIFNTSASIARYLARISPQLNLYRSTSVERAEVDHWITFSLTPLSCEKHFADALSSLNDLLTSNKFLVGESISLADVTVWALLYSNVIWRNLSDKEKIYNGIYRWYESLLSDERFKNVISKLPSQAKEPVSVVAPKAKSDEKKVGKKDEGKFVDLPDAEMGKVIVRFPPEPSGYLHIGHAKAALLNQHYQHAFKGKLILRFDDTNPAKENEEFERVIMEDLQMLEIKQDRTTHTSDYFDLMMKYCEKMIREEKAYCDDTDAETMKLEREQKKESKNRANDISTNLNKWNEMISGSVEGLRWCVRAKIDMQSVNGCMRDPTIYRCKCEPHLRTGLKYKVYPTYDFACPIVDSIEGVTHALRTTEYHDRDEQYMWFLKQLQLRNIHVWEYSRLNMINTVLSKRKLTWFVSEGLVDGWDDPRFPTVRGVLRRGMTVQGLKDFIVAQGGSRSVVTMEWDKIWAFNKKVIDPIAPRFTAIDKSNVPVTVTGAAEENLKVPKHPKNEIIGLKDVWTSSNILIDEADAETLKEGENTTFINWGNLLIEKINRNGAGKVTSVIAKPNLENKDFKKTLKLTWLAKVKSAPMIPCVCVYFDHIISKPVLDRDDDFKKYIAKNTRIEVEMLGDPELRHLKKSDVIQLQRKGFFICDSPYIPLSPHSSCESPIILFYIPDGHMKELATLGLNKIRESSPKEVKQSARGKSAEKSPLGEVAQTVIGANELQKLNEAITAQGDKVRQLKASNCSKEEVTASVKELLNLKAQYKKVSGKDWQPQAAAAVKETSPSGPSELQLNEAITAQGDKVRQLKSSKASKEEVTNSVKVLLDLKAQYKKVVGKDWQPQATAAIIEPTPSSPNDLQQLNEAIIVQGDKVRQLKGTNSSKEEVTASVKVLLDLKAQYKKASGKDWQPQATATIIEPTPSSPNDLQQLNEAIILQGDKVRQLKGSNSSKDEVTASVKVLLDLKAQYKKVSGKDWQPQATAAVATEPSSKERKTSENQQKVLAQAKMGVSTEDPSAVELKSKIDAQGEKVRLLKTTGGAASDIDKEVKALLELKNQYKQLTGEDLAGGGKSKKGKKEKKETKQEPAAKLKAVDTSSVNNPGLKKVTRLGLETTKEESLSDWYTQVITKAEMIEYYDVSGCYILRPWAFSIWEAITNFFDAEIKKIGVQNCYFPMFISQSALNKEKTHIADFAPEVAWVTKSGDSDLAEPIAIRPTSETVMYPSYAKWIKSHRDLPLKLNQWCSVVRWEFKHPQPFLRTREFLWQEGHSAFATRTEAEEEVYTILELYRRVYEELMAIPVIKGKKTEKEKFAGGDFTTTIEAYVSCSGRGLQAATSHHLGQNFSKMFEIIIDHPETGEKQFVYQNSWGLSTRSIGALVMIHADNTGLVLPPRVACVQIVIVPCGVTANTSEGDNKALITKCEEYEKKLKEAGVRTRGDYRDNYSPGWKFNHWELKGVPIRLEVGPRDIKQGQCVAVRRDNGEKVTIKEATAVKDLLTLLETIHTSLFNKAKKDMDNHLTVAHEWKEFCDKLDKKNIIQSPFCGEPKCEEEIKNDSAKDESSTAQGPSMGAKSLCIPFVQPGELKADAHCINSKCKNKPKFYTLFGRSY